MQKKCVTVPAGVGAGQLLQVQTPAGLMRCTVPLGLMAGQQFVLLVPAPPTVAAPSTTVPPQEQRAPLADGTSAICESLPSPGRHATTDNGAKVMAGDGATAKKRDAAAMEELTEGSFPPVGQPQQQRAATEAPPTDGGQHKKKRDASMDSFPPAGGGSSDWVRRSSRRHVEPERLVTKQEKRAPPSLRVYLVGKNDWHGLER